MKKNASDQISRFKETARALGCDEDKERFEAALGKVATHKPAQKTPPKLGKKRRKDKVAE